MCTEGVFLQKKRESPGWGEINPSSSRSARDRCNESLAFIHMYTALVSSRFIFREKPCQHKSRCRIRGDRNRCHIGRQKRKGEKDQGEGAKDRQLY